MGKYMDDFDLDIQKVTYGYDDANSAWTWTCDGLGTHCDCSAVTLCDSDFCPAFPSNFPACNTRTSCNGC